MSQETYCWYAPGLWDRRVDMSSVKNDQDDSLAVVLTTESLTIIASTT